MKKKRLLFLTAITISMSACMTVKNVPPTLVPTIAIHNSEALNSLSSAVTAEPIALLQETAVPPTLPPTNTLAPSPSATPTEEPTATITATPAWTATPTLTPTATFWPTVTRQVLPEAVSAGLVPCQNRQVDTELLAVVTQQFSLPETYAPADMVPLSDYFDGSITLDQELYVRQVIVEPLQRIIEAMHGAGLRPSIISAYRSYGEQALAWQWWSGQYPGRVAILSARPGYSEHQLGTTVDFGSPAIDHLFHVDFATTAEGVWLTNNAHLYGFTLSYPANTYDITGIKYEPWHFRYVGTNLATQLFNSGQLLTSWQLENLPSPCIP
jgi:D-alanyl-D-alanine carboxypeptidase